jgi:hypothetical protein
MNSATYTEELLTILKDAVSTEFPYDGRSAEITYAGPSEVSSKQEASLVGYFGVISDDTLRLSWLNSLESAGISKDHKVKGAARHLADLEGWGRFIRATHWAIYERVERRLSKLKAPRALRDFHDELLKNVRGYVLACGSRSERPEPYKPFLRDYFAWPRAFELKHQLSLLRNASPDDFSSLRASLIDFGAFKPWLEEMDQIDSSVRESIQEGRTRPDEAT